MREQVYIPFHIFRAHPRCFAVEVNGRCMEPTVPNGSIVAVDPAIQPSPDGSDIAVVRVGKTQYICKPVRIMGQIIMLHDNPVHRNITLPEDKAKVVGMVVWVQKCAGYTSVNGSVFIRKR